MQNGKVKASFRLNGGIGTYLAELNFIQCLYDFFPDCISITVYGGTSTVINDGLMAEQYFVDQYYDRKDFNEDGYDLVVDINWFPHVRKVDLERINDISPEFAKMVRRWIHFQSNSNTRHLVSESSMFDYSIYTYAMVNNKNRLSLMDITNKLGLEKEFRYKLTIIRDEDIILKKFGLAGKRYITMQQGVNAQSKVTLSPRQWPLEYFSKLCELIKSRYPNIILIQLGELENNEVICGIDYCLLGKTDFEELKVLLKNAYMHIDGECGMVHMRNALQAAPSVVLYGQTPIDLRSYPNNINISPDTCEHGCATLFNAWKRRCFIGNGPVCMTSITPVIVFGAIKKYLETGEISQIAGNKRIETNTVKETLLKRYGKNLDYEWTNRWLTTVNIYGFTEVKLRLNQLTALKLTEHGYVKVKLEKHPAYSFLTGDKQTYADYMELNNKLNPGHEHSMKRFKELVQGLNEYGAKENRYIAINGMCIILDGVHFACWLLNQYGGEYEVKTLKIYGSFRIIE